MRLTLPRTFPLAFVLAVALAAPAAGGEPAPVIHTEDVALFYRLYDATGGHPTAAQLQYDYLDQGSAGLHVLASERNVSGEAIAKELSLHPEVYAGARACADALPGVKRRVADALADLKTLYPPARLPPVTITIGRGKPVGIGGPEEGVVIGLEALCATAYLNPNVEDRFVHVIAHEYIHVQQARTLLDKDNPTVLEQSLLEGAAEFMAERISGGVAYSRLAASAGAHAREIETAFVADEDKTDLSAWLNNGTADKPGDLGYWVGYRIVKAYYQHAPDKTRAIRDILQMTDAKAFLAASGWYPGIQLD